VVSATGLKLLALGGPNLGWVVGYTNISWTLRCNLTCACVCRLLNHMDADGHRYCVPELDGRDVAREPIVDLKSGYILPGIQSFPKQVRRRRGAAIRTTCATCAILAARRSTTARSCSKSASGLRRLARTRCKRRRKRARLKLPAPVAPPARRPGTGPAHSPALREPLDAGPDCCSFVRGGEVLVVVALRAAPRRWVVTRVAGTSCDVPSWEQGSLASREPLGRPLAGRPAAVFERVWARPAAAGRAAPFR